MHTLGLHHEFTRYDRDNYVDIYTNNVETGNYDNHHVQNNVFEANFNIFSGQDYNFDKRYSSSIDRDTKYNIYSMYV